VVFTLTKSAAKQPLKEIVAVLDLVILENATQGTLGNRAFNEQSIEAQNPKFLDPKHPGFSYSYVCAKNYTLC
jgi:hypothetical protein